MGKRTLRPPTEAPDVDEQLDDLDENFPPLVDEDEDDDPDDDELNGHAPAEPETACLYCGCTENAACETDEGPCSWIPGDDNVCTNPECIAKHRAAGHMVEGFEADDPRELSVASLFTPFSLSALPAKMRLRPLAAQSNSWMVATIGRLVDELQDLGASEERDSLVDDLVALDDAAATRDISDQLSHTMLAAISELRLAAAGADPTGYEIVDDRPIESYLGKRTMSALSPSARERPLREQSEDWLLKTIVALTDEISAVRNGNGTRTEQEVAKDLEALLDRAEDTGVAEQLSMGVRLFAASVIVPLPTPANQASASVGDANPPIAEREAARDTEIGQVAEMPGSPAEREPIGRAGNLPGEPLITDLVVELPLSDILIDLAQPRDEGADDEIGEEITPATILPPIEVRPNPDPEANCPYILIDGERRYRGSARAGRSTIRAIVNATPMDAGDLLLRQSKLNEGKRLKPMEEARTWKRIMNAKGWTAQQLADEVNRAKSTVSDRLAMLNAPAPFQPLFEKGVMPPAAAPIMRAYADLPERVVKSFAKSLTEEFRDFVTTETAVPLVEIERALQHASYGAGLRNINHSADAAKSYEGDVCTIKGAKYAVDGKAWDKHVQEYSARKHAPPAERQASAAEKAEATRQANERKRGRQKAELRRAQFDAITAKLPLSIGGSANQGDGWSMLLVDLVMKEVHADTLRVLAAQLQLTGQKARAGGMGQYGEMIKRHAATLSAPQRVRLALQLLLAPDLNIPSYIARGPERLAAAAKLARVDLKKVKVPDPEKPVPPKRLPGKSDFMQPCQVDSALAAIVGDKPQPRTEVTKKLWAYIKKNDLQDKKERRYINADEKLKAVFGNKKRVSMFEMTKLVNKHLVGPIKGGKR